MSRQNRGRRILAVMMALAICICGVSPVMAAYETTIDTFECRGMTVPAYDGDPYEVVNDNETSFTEAEKAGSWDQPVYAELDELGRVGTVAAMIDQEVVSGVGERGDISGIRPTGWIQNKYDTSLVEAGWIYNRSHLYAHSLGGADCEKNLCTGTRSFNVNGMFNSSESPVLNYIKGLTEENDYHVLYRVTPVFFGDELLTRGVLIEAETLENEDINICVFCYNVQPGIALDYLSGANILESAMGENDPDDEEEPSAEESETASVSMSSVSVSLPGTKVYTGKALKPVIKLTDRSGNVLTAGADYTAVYSNNVKPGKASVRLTGKGKYTGTKTVGFYIKPGKTAMKKVKGAKRSFTVRWKKQAGVTGYQIAYKKKGASKYKVVKAKSTSSKKIIKKLRRGKKYKVKVRAYKKIDGKILYGAYSRVRTVKVR